MVEAQAANTRGQVFAAAVLLGWALSAAQPAAGQEPIDGVCDDSVRNGCAAGTANDEAFPDQPNGYLWRCDGLHGGRNSDKCFLPVRVDGVCDESVRNGCAAGRANDAAFPDYSTVYVWRCDGLNGGTNSSKCAKFVSGGTPPYTYPWNAVGVDLEASSSGASVTFSYPTRPASIVIDFTVDVRDSVGLFGSTEYSWGTPPTPPGR